MKTMKHDFLGNEFLSIQDKYIIGFEMKKVSGDNCYMHYRLIMICYAALHLQRVSRALSEGVVEQLDFACPGQATCAKPAETVGKGLLPPMPYRRVY
jgi:hypothetical protein